MPSSSPDSSATASQAVYSEKVTNQTLMGLIVTLQAQLASMSRQQDQLMQVVLHLQRQSASHAELTTHVSGTIAQPSPDRVSTTVPMVAGPVATGSALSPSQSTESFANPQARTPIPGPSRKIKREGAFCHISNKEETPWKAPGGYHPDRDATHPTRGTSPPERPESPFPPPHHPPVLRPRVPGSHDERNHLPLSNLLSPFRSPTSQGSQPSPSLPTPPLPQANDAPTLPLPEAGPINPTRLTQPARSPRRNPSHREGPLSELSLFGDMPLRIPSPRSFRPPHYLPITAPTTPAATLPSPKRKREGAGDAEASDKKRARCSSSDVD